MKSFLWSKCFAGGISGDKQLQNETETSGAGMEDTTLARTGSTFLTLWVTVIFVEFENSVGCVKCL